MEKLLTQTGFYQFFAQTSADGLFVPLGLGQVIMICVCLFLLYLGVAKKFEPLLLVPIAIGGLLSNMPLSGLTGEGGLLTYLYHVGIETSVFPLLIFLGVGAMTDFGPLIANPKTALLGGAAQFAIFGTFLGAAALSDFIPGISLTMKQMASIAIIGGADGPTSIFITGKLAPELLGAITVAAYSYMALIPVIQPPIMRALTTPAERQIKMQQLREVSWREKMIFPVLVVILTGLFIPMAMPLLGMLMLGNILKESGATNRLAETASNSLINIVTILLGITVGEKLSAALFLNVQTLVILVLGIVAFCIGTASGVLMAKVMNLFSKNKINPLIGSAGVSAIPMAARVSHKLGQEADSSNFLIMHAMGPNVAGCIGSALVAGILIALLG